MKNRLYKLKSSKSTLIICKQNKISKILNNSFKVGNKISQNEKNKILSPSMKGFTPLKPIQQNNIIFKDNKLISFKNLKDKIKNKEECFKRLNMNYFKYEKCISQRPKKIEIVANNKPKLIENDDKDDNEDINIDEFFDKINKEFEDNGKLIKLNFEIDGKIKYIFEKNEFVLLKIIQNELKEKNSLDIKEFIYQDKPLNLFKSLRGNNLYNNCTIKIIL